MRVSGAWGQTTERLTTHTQHGTAPAVGVRIPRDTGEEVAEVETKSSPEVRNASGFESSRPKHRRMRRHLVGAPVTVLWPFASLCREE